MLTEVSALICELQEPPLQSVVALLTSAKAFLPRLRLRHLSAVHCSFVRALQCNLASTCWRSSGAHLTAVQAQACHVWFIAALATKWEQNRIDMLSMPGIDKCTAQIASRSAGVAGVALSRTLQEGALLALAAVCYQAREHPTEVRMRPWQCDATLTPRLTGWYRGQQSRAMSPSIANLGVAGAFVCVAAIHEDVTACWEIGSKTCSGHLRMPAILSR